MLEATLFDQNLRRANNSDKGEIVCKSEEGHKNMCNSTIPRGQDVAAEYLNKSRQLYTSSTITIKIRHWAAGQIHKNELIISETTSLG